MIPLRYVLLTVLIIGASSARLAAFLKPAFVPNELIVVFNVTPEAISLRAQVEQALFDNAQVEPIQTLSGQVVTLVRLKPGTGFGAAFQAI